MTSIGLSSGEISYRDTGGIGPTIVLLHGLLMDASLWDEVVSNLQSDHRCIAPTLPLGAHQTIISPTADLSLHGIAELVIEFLERLDLTDVTLVGNDTGGALVQLIAASNSTDRVGRMCLVACEAFDNVPPGLTGKTVVTIGRLHPTLFRLFMQQMRLKPARRLPIAFGWLTRRGDAPTARWMKGLLRNKQTCRDAVKVLRSLRQDSDVLLDIEDQLAKCTIETLIVWAKDDRVMPPEHGRRLAQLIPSSRLIEISDSRSLIPLDQPERLATALRRFASGDFRNN